MDEGMNYDEVNHFQAKNCNNFQPVILFETVKTFRFKEIS